MTVNDIEITPETILATRNHFVDIYKKCIESAINGELKVNDLNKYVQSQETNINKILTGYNDHTLTFLQRALWLQTGNMPSIL